MVPANWVLTERQNHHSPVSHREKTKIVVRIAICIMLKLDTYILYFGRQLKLWMRRCFNNNRPLLLTREWTKSLTNRSTWLTALTLFDPTKSQLIAWLRLIRYPQQKHYSQEQIFSLIWITWEITIVQLLSRSSNFYWVRK